jgi:YVTN family beta-propeller protein
MHRLVSFPEAEGLNQPSRGNALGLLQAHFLSPETAGQCDGDVFLQRRSWSFSKAWAPYLFMFDMKASSILVGLLVICSNPCLAEEAPAARKLYVANTAGESLSLIDLDRREVVRELQIGKHPHGLAVAPDQGVIYCSVESERVIKFIDTTTDQVIAKVNTTGVPNQLAITPDGRWVYVAINDNGKADVIDVRQRKVSKTLDVGPRAHNCYAPKGAKHMYATSIGDHVVKQFDFANDHALTMTVKFDAPVRPLCITQDEKWLFVALEGLHGFAWADLATGKQLGRMEQPLPPAEKRSKFAYMNTHGLELRPGDRELWVTSFIGNGLMVYDITSQPPKYVTTVAVGDAPNWLTFSPDGKFAYSANAGANSITVVDCDKRTALKDIKVGATPKRLLEVHPPPTRASR